ncbi:ferritin-like domain-containing protein [Maribacter sp. 2210JD10-5]|uniref:YciE/YciF ferroxidase family protein n=1 Tax=Maribacter sp. 2210JD10-5 TaxID=3386272 RepID=UPI0039BD920E
MKTLKDLFEHQLKDLYNAETQQLDALPKMIDHANDNKLKEAFKNSLKETKEQRNRLTDICSELNIEPTGETCNAMEGLIEEAEGFFSEPESSDVMDAGLIAEAQRIEHYEISGYGTAVRYAKELGHKNIASKLQETLDEEYNCDQRLDKLAESRINEKAIA